MAEKLDLQFLPPVKWLDFDFTNLEKYWPDLAQVEGAGRSMHIYFKVFMGTAIDQAHDLLNYSEALKPDVLVTEPHAFGTQIVSLKLGIPWAVAGIALGVLSLPIIGQKGVPLSNQPFLYLAQGVPAFDAHKSNLFPQTHYVGGLLWDEGQQSDPQTFKLPQTDLPLVFVSLGTMFARESHLRKIVEAAVGQPWHLLISTSAKVDPAQLEPLPPNVTALPYVPYSLVWPHIAAFVTHGPAAALLGALGQGIPLVVTPLEADQLANADAIINAGAGLRLGLDNSTPAALQEAINGVLTDPQYRQAARRLQGELAGTGGAEQAATLLEQLVVQRQPILAASASQ